MNVFTAIKARINRGKMLRLNAPGNNTIIHGDTQEVITIDTIKEILSNEQSFERFLDWSKNQEYFAGQLTFNDYMQAIRDYISYFIERGVTVDKDELKRASIITGEKYKNNKSKKSNKLSPEEQIAGAIYERGKIDDLITQNEDKNHEVNETLKTKIYDLRNTFHGYRVSLNNSILNAIGNLESKDIENSVETNRGIDEEKFNPDKYTMDRNLKKLLISKIPGDTTDKGVLAYQIYNAVYSTLQYESGYFIKRSDPNGKSFSEALKDIMVSKVTPDKKRVTCTTEAEIYCYMLSLYGIDSVLMKGFDIDANGNKSKLHWYAKVLLDDDTIVADGTNCVTDKEGYHLSDMTRMKVGLAPANFISARGRDYIDESLLKKSAYSFKDELKEILGMITVQNSKKDEPKISVTQKVEILKAQLMKVNKQDIGNTETYQYIRELVTRLFDKEQEMDEQMIGISASLYTEEKKDEFSYYPIIFIRQQDAGYAYYCLDKENGLKSIDAKTIRDRIDAGELQVIFGKNNRIPGLYDDVNEQLDHIPDDANDRADDSDERV